MRSLAPSGLRRIAGRISWTIVDQVLSALSNVLLAVLVARVVDATGFGAFSLAFLVFTLLVAVSRALVGQPLQITFAAAAPRQFRSAVRSALGASLVIGLVSGLAAAGVGLAVGDQTGGALIALGACLPGLLVQDTCRMAFFAAGHPRGAAAIDALWAGLLFAGLAIVLAGGLTAIWVPIAVWGAGAAVAAVAGIILLGARPRLRGSISWTLGQRRLTGYLLAEYLLGQGVAQVGILMVAIIGSAAGVGALRAAQVLLGPLNILGAAAFMFAVPEIARRPDMSQRNRGLLTVGVSGAMGAITAVYAGLILLIPDSLGQELLGDTWSGANQVLIPMCVLSLAAALATGPAATLYGLGLARATFFINITKAPLLVVLMVIGIPNWGAQGAAWAMALTEILLLPMWLMRVRRALRDPGVPNAVISNPNASAPADPAPAVVAPGYEPVSVSKIDSSADGGTR